jgi:hypothetical protein
MQPTKLACLIIRKYDKCWPALPFTAMPNMIVLLTAIAHWTKGNSSARPAECYSVRLRAIRCYLFPLRCPNPLPARSLIQEAGVLGPGILVQEPLGFLSAGRPFSLRSSLGPLLVITPCILQSFVPDEDLEKSCMIGWLVGWQAQSTP